MRKRSKGHDNKTCCDSTKPHHHIIWLNAFVATQLTSKTKYSFDQRKARTQKFSWKNYESVIVKDILLMPFIFLEESSTYT